MKVHRIITTIEVENDNSITSVELTKLYPADADIPLAVTNLTTNGNADDIEQVYGSVNKHRFDIGSKLKDIARIIDDGIDDYECGIICINAYDDKYDDETETSYISELTTTHLVKQDDVGMTNVNGADTDITNDD